MDLIRMYYIYMKLLMNNLIKICDVKIIYRVIFVVLYIYKGKFRNLIQIFFKLKLIKRLFKFF